MRCAELPFEWHANNISAKPGRWSTIQSALVVVLAGGESGVVCRLVGRNAEATVPNVRKIRTMVGRTVSYTNNAASVLMDIRRRDEKPYLRVLATCPDTDRCDSRCARRRP
jgi:hypothetical protein